MKLYKISLLRDPRNFPFCYTFSFRVIELKMVALWGCLLSAILQSSSSPSVGFSNCPFSPQSPHSSRNLNLVTSPL